MSLDIDYQKLSGVPGKYKVGLYFKLYGILGYEVYFVEVRKYGVPYFLAYMRLEEELINLGLKTHSCSCCLFDENIELKDLDFTIEVV